MLIIMETKQRNRERDREIEPEWNKKIGFLFVSKNY
jgi:hypothetical protein